MLKHYLTIALIVLIAAKLTAVEKHSSGARALALSDAFVSVSDIWATFHNQATLADFNQFSAGVFYESKFLVDELSHTAGTMILPVKPGTFGFSFSQFGKGTYKEHQLGFAFSRMLGKKLAASLQFDYFSTHFPENDRSIGLATFEAGILFHASEKIKLGAHIFNPVQAGFKTESETRKAPATIRIGGHYKFPSFVMVAAEAEKQFNGPLLIKTGIEFMPVDYLFLRIGVSGKPVNYTAGIGYRFGKIITDIGFGYHGNLGISPAISIQFEL